MAWLAEGNPDLAGPLVVGRKPAGHRGARRAAWHTIAQPVRLELSFFLLQPGPIPEIAPRSDSHPAQRHCGPGKLPRMLSDDDTLTRLQSVDGDGFPDDCAGCEGQGGCGRRRWESAETGSTGPTVRRAAVIACEGGRSFLQGDGRSMMHGIVMSPN